MSLSLDEFSIPVGIKNSSVRIIFHKNKFILDKASIVVTLLEETRTIVV